MAKILLNWLPPSMENMPSPAHSVLKNTLEGLGYDVYIEYWKILSLCNKQICSIEMIMLELGLEKSFVVNIIDSLANEKLLYSNSDYSEIVTIINTENIK